MKAYNNDAKLKERFIVELQKHYDADQIVQGTYGEENGSWKGCALACSLRSLDIIDGKELQTEYSTHQEYETRLGIPATIAHLEDRIFEGLPVDKEKEWPLRFGKAIPVGADLSLVTPKFLVWLLKDVKQYATDSPDVLAAIDKVITLYERVIAGDDVPTEDFEAVRAAGDTAWDTAWAAGDAAWDAAWVAREVAGDAAWAAKYEQMADKLIELLEQEGLSDSE
jgi:hypothetical protein